MKYITLTRGMKAIVDDSDYEEVCKHRWYYIKYKNLQYAATTENDRALYLHRFLLRPEKGMVIDHKNGDGLDNQRHNLRICTVAQNAANSSGKNVGTRQSKYKGVYKNNVKGGYHSQIMCKGISYYLGRYKDEIEAAKAYNKKSKELFGDFAFINPEI